MKKIILRNAKNKKIAPDLVRFFKFNDAYYLIYTFHEKDEKNFVKLYVVRILEELGKPVASYLETDWEWEEIQEIVKQMLRELKKNNVVSFKDLNPKGIQGLKIQEPRSFKLLETLVEILSGDKVVTVEQENIQEPKDNIANLNSPQAPIVQTREETQKSIHNMVEEPLLDQNLHKETLKEDRKEEKINPNKAALQESLENAVMTELAYHKLQQENENLKKQLLQYQIKYQALKDLLTKDE